MRKLLWTSFSVFLFLALLVQTGCTPTPGNDGDLPLEQNSLQASLTATTVAPAASTPIPASSETPTPVLATTTPTVDQLAVMLAQQLAPQFTQIYGVQFSPSLAKGLDTDKIGGPAGQLAQMIAPVVDANQSYTDRNQQVREVEGILSLNDSRLDFEAITILNKGTIQFFPIPLGAYMIACHRERPNDCLAISLEREEFQIDPESVSIIPIPDPPTVTPAPTGTPTLTQTPTATGTVPPTGTPCVIGQPCPTPAPTLLATFPPPATPTVAAIFTSTAAPTLSTPPPPTVGFEDGSIRTCFWVFRRKVCIRVF